MIVYLFRILIIAAVILLIYSIIQYFRNPDRLLKNAKETKGFYFLDEQHNSKKNIRFVYKGCQFEGEKYVGATEESFEIVDIHVTVTNPLELQGLSRDDIYFLEKELLIRYPHAKISWKHPINKLLVSK
ncbi:MULTISPECIES: sigma-w pathway protein ysdB [Ornithinibacillus]|uniref:Sigma-w pathway protein ysdB n=2 Tax=Ornithinibacillus TaxID=484508 RepID=A0A923L6M8_9BACI|nr:MULTISPECIES: sigma-w pathway protein ysdB [Ornithinibacillus]MBC5637503.1 sigma-w pathway protein ysdB [Ornithinibacillus hominis]MBS3682071.1 sigma-w pathway protein ysdB [Ornithinibacillus massiliensis]